MNYKEFSLDDFLYLHLNNEGKELCNKTDRTLIYDINFFYTCKTQDDQSSFLISGKPYSIQFYKVYTDHKEKLRISKTFKEGIYQLNLIRFITRFKIIENKFCVTFGDKHYIDSKLSEVINKHQTKDNKINRDKVNKVLRTRSVSMKETIEYFNLSKKFLI
jgi:hypothetical protein